MTEAAPNHPTVETLHALSLGQLTEAELAPILAHLGDCPACCRRIDQLASDDRLLTRLQQRAGSPEEALVSPAQRRPAVRALRHVPEPVSGTRKRDPKAGTVSANTNASTVKTHRDAQRSKVLPDELTRVLAPPERPDEIGRLGPYRILAVLGQGGMGVVFLADDPALDRIVALKVMLPHVAAVPSARDRFLREAKAAAALKHPHVVTIFQVGEDRGAPFLAMEFLEGESLSDRIHREGWLPMAEVLRIGRETAEGLTAAHVRGLVHRDIKPANLWLEGPTGHVKILDFGLVRASADQANLTQSGILVGTPAYMAPEQAEGKPLDPRCDLFSLGCILYEMSTGKPPFPGENIIAVLRALALHEPPPVGKFRPDMPLELSALVARLLAKKPEDRLASAQEVAKTLRAMDLPTTLLPPEPGARPARTSRIPLVAVSGAALAVTLVLSLLVALRPTPLGTVGIESDDPAVEVVFDKDGPTIKGADEPLAGWLEEVAALPFEEQVKVVGGKLQELNPGFDGQVIYRIEDVGVRLELVTDHVTNFTPLRALTGVNVLSCTGSAMGKGHVADVETIRGMRLVGLNCRYANVADLAPLAGMKLIYLGFSGTAVTDLEPLRGMPMEFLYFNQCPGIKSLTPLEGMPLKHFHCTATRVTDLAPLRGMKLERFRVALTPVTDLAPLQGMPLQFLDFSSTQVEDLAPLQGMELTELHCKKTRVTDLSLLRGMPLKILSCDFRAERDAAILRSITTLEQINGKSAAAFWREVDAPPVAQMP